jgi:hypothetical protein
MCRCGQVSGKLNCGRNMDFEFRVDAGFACDKASATATLLERKIKRYNT